MANRGRFQFLFQRGGLNNFPRLHLLVMGGGFVQRNIPHLWINTNDGIFRFPFEFTFVDGSSSPHAIIPSDGSNYQESIVKLGSDSCCTKCTNTSGEFSATFEEPVDLTLHTSKSRFNKNVAPPPADCGESIQLIPSRGVVCNNFCMIFSSDQQHG